MAKKLNTDIQSVENKRNQSIFYSDPRKTINGKLYLNIAHVVDPNLQKLTPKEIEALTSIKMLPIYKFCNSRVKTRSGDSKTLVPFNNALIGVVEQSFGKDSVYIESNGQSVRFTGVLADPNVLKEVDTWFDMLVKFSKIA